ncbi:hypothetical protein L3V83_15610 [Thiotrichales bacterium 19X7-9]|nr:hypothetical protein [Thiotrichales bacterium 19X7-9]
MKKLCIIFSLTFLLTVSYADTVTFVNNTSQFITATNLNQTSGYYFKCLRKQNDEAFKRIINPINDKFMDFFILPPKSITQFNFELIGGCNNLNSSDAFAYFTSNNIKKGKVSGNVRIFKKNMKLVASVDSYGDSNSYITWFNNSNMMITFIHKKPNPFRGSVAN